ncbi:hypothetical protein CKO28_00620 [Rhodovibrio sodomensis]|uniref:Uncharacterized protein n=1 Tax=Rhodovibrio sodomensis TaxID=1088 RepID=A0ABS1D940_9PROT|nr:hypothetical protein [Rhodovibrio sodomensis]MBK1666544.1 hypothetical protein [Rhodovibrio sodomensis]
MNIDLDNRKMQTLARALRRELNLGDDHRGVLDALAKGFGFKSYGAMKDNLSASPNDTAATAPAVSADLVTFAVLPDGFRVQVLDPENQPIEAIDEGDSSGDSVTRTGPGFPGVGYRKLFVWARDRALECARKYGLPDTRVLHDTDLEDLAEEDLPEGVSADPTDWPKNVEVTFAPTVQSLGVTVSIFASDNADFVAQLRSLASKLVPLVNNGLNEIGGLNIPGAGDYGLHLSLAEPGRIVDIYED